MAYQALYRKWRPKSFDDVVGQSHIVYTLKNEISSGKPGHAYLFCGERGTGKTSCAKIFARAVNCQNPKNGNPCNECEICRGALDGSIMDITEIDAASNNGVDNIREIRDEVSYSAAQAKYKIYIIDEVHMLSGGAFNALLKTLEEPPEHVIFILATTEVHKLPATITSRCQRFDFRRISVRDILNRLREICTAEKIDADIDALTLIARMADGAMRDALSILDRVNGSCEKITAEAAREVLAVASDEAVDASVAAIASSDCPMILSAVDNIVQSGRDINNYIEMLIKRFRDILVCKAAKNSGNLFDGYSDEAIDEIKSEASLFSAEKLSYITETLCHAAADAKWQKNARTLYEIALMRICLDKLNSSNEALLARIERLEASLGAGADFLKKEPNDTPKPKNDELPPWELDESDNINTAEANIVENISADKEKNEMPDKENTAKTETKAQAPFQNTDNDAKVKPPRLMAQSWQELLLILKKKSPPLYGALCMKRAKFSGRCMYLINEVYVKNILSMLEDDFRSALALIAPDIKVNFVTESEFDMIDEDKKDESLHGQDIYEHKDITKQNPLPDNESDQDPLDELLNMNNDDITEE